MLASVRSAARRLYTTAVDAPPTPPKGAYPSAQHDPFNFKQLKSKVKDYSLATRERPKYRLHCHSSRNNTINTFTDELGNTRSWFSGGSCGFKRVNRSSYEAGYQCAIRIFDQIAKTEEALRKEKGLPDHIRAIDVEVFFKGFGNGREALQKALLTSEGDKVRPFVVSVTDRTPIKIGGTRAKKVRRL